MCARPTRGCQEPYDGETTSVVGTRERTERAREVRDVEGDAAHGVAALLERLVEQHELVAVGRQHERLAVLVVHRVVVLGRAGHDGALASEDDGDKVVAALVLFDAVVVRELEHKVVDLVAVADHGLGPRARVRPVARGLTAAVELLMAQHTHAENIDVKVVVGL